MRDIYAPSPNWVRGADLVAVPIHRATVVAQPSRSGPGRSVPSENDRRQGRNRLADVADTKPVTEVVVEGQPKLLAGLHETKHDVARDTALSIPEERNGGRGGRFFNRAISSRSS